jgi:hypothetical protein
MATYKDQMVGILDRYIEEVNSEPTTLDDVFDWALSHGLYHPEPRDIRRISKRPWRRPCDNRSALMGSGGIAPRPRFVKTSVAFN